MKRRPESRSFWNSWAGVCAVAFFVALLFFLVTEHTAHVFGVLPWAILLLCPIMHLLMHRGHSSKGGHQHE